MDGETSYESDISESWSVIDINLNEECDAVVEAQSLIQPTDNTPIQSNNVNIKKEETIGLKDFSNKSKDESQTANRKPSDSDSDSSFQNENFIASVKEDLDEESRRRESDEGSKNDSCDAESIEILDVDGIDRDTDIDRLDISFIHGSDLNRTYNSDDEESFYEENVNNESKKTCLAVIKRKRRKLSRHSNSSTDSVNRDCMSSSEKYSNKHSSEGIKSDDESRVQSCELIGRPVYKHYRNNVTNTVLSLSMGVIFAGVACIAIGHFLGVHDTGETAVELMKTLKKLQMENIVLQSRLSHLNRAFITRDMSSKLEQSTHESYDKSFCDRKPELGATKTEETEPNPAALPPPTSKPPSSQNSIKWLTQLQNLVQSQSSRLNSENEVDLNKIVKNIHDQLTFINRKKKEDAKLKHLEDSDARISRILQKIIGKLSLSQDNIEKLYQKLVKLKNKLNKQLSKILVEENLEEGLEEKFQKTEKRKPVTERDLLSIQWNPKRKETNYNDNSCRDSVLVYKFPQPEEHYILEKEALENLTESIEDDNAAADSKPVSLPSEEVSNKDKPTQTTKIPEEFSAFEKKENKEYESDRRCKSESARGKHRDKKREGKKSENNSKKEKVKGEKRHKRTLNKLQDDDEEPEKNNRKRNKGLNLKETQTKYSLKKMRQAFNETKYQKKKHFKMEKLVQKVFKQKSIKKKSKKPKSKRVFFSSMFGKGPRDSSRSKNYCSAAEEYDGRCFNLTGGWIFKWAGGREESRKHESLGDWQFERAKGRKELRGEDLNVNWQFRRASARESTRNDDRWLYEKYRNHNQKGFFHEGYSWI